jgi:hypothetical protein
MKKVFKKKAAAQSKDRKGKRKARESPERKKVKFEEDDGTEWLSGKLQ